MRVLGIDPGLRLAGFACIEGDGTPTIVEAGVYRLVTGARTPPVSERLAELDRDFGATLVRTRPDAVAVEALFAHYKHPATAIGMAHARGVLLLAIARAGVPLVELRPNAVKKSLVGHGHASKAQMQSGVQRVFGLAEPPSPPDVADALAIALCAWQRSSATLAV